MSRFTVLRLTACLDFRSIVNISISVHNVSATSLNCAKHLHRFLGVNNSKLQRFLIGMKIVFLSFKVADKNCKLLEKIKLKSRLKY